MRARPSMPAARCIAGHAPRTRLGDASGHEVQRPVAVFLREQLEAEHTVLREVPACQSTRRHCYEPRAAAANIQTNKQKQTQ